VRKWRFASGKTRETCLHLPGVYHYLLHLVIYLYRRHQVEIYLL
jgi:hypothetical protein